MLMFSLSITPWQYLNPKLASQFRVAGWNLIITGKRLTLKRNLCAVYFYMTPFLQLFSKMASSKMRNVSIGALLFNLWASALNAPNECALTVPSWHRSYEKNVCKPLQTK